VSAESLWSITFADPRVVASTLIDNRTRPIHLLTSATSTTLTTWMTARSDWLGRITIVVVDDHPVVRNGLVALLRTIPGLEVVGEAADGEAAVPVVEELEPDAVLMDVRMPGWMASRQHAGSGSRRRDAGF
jgi:PleD family two-component response regulator